MTFGEKVRTARQAQGMSQRDLARISGIALRTIVNYESGSRMPKSRESYTRLAGALGLDPGSLADDSAEFLIRSEAEYGPRGRRQAEELVADISALYAGGDLAEEDMDAMMKAIQDAYWEAKRINRRHVPSKYRGEEGK